MFFLSGKLCSTILRNFKINFPFILLDLSFKNSFYWDLGILKCSSNSLIICVQFFFMFLILLGNIHFIFNLLLSFYIWYHFLFNFHELLFSDFLVFEPFYSCFIDTISFFNFFKKSKYFFTFLDPCMVFYSFKLHFFSDFGLCLSYYRQYPMSYAPCLSSSSQRGAPKNYLKT